MASFDRGTKRQCVHCAMKYYDLNRDPILCPGCGKPYEPPEDPVARKSADKDNASKTGKTDAKTAPPEPAATTAGTKIASFEDTETDTDETDEATGEDIPDVEGVEDIGGEVDNSFVENDDDDDDIEFNVVKPKADE